MRTVKRAVALAALLPCIMTAPTITAPAGASHLQAPQTTTSQPEASQPEALAQPDHQLPPDQGRARAQVGLGLTKVSPKTVRENSRIELAGVAQNRSGHELSGLTIRMRYRQQPITSRGELDQIAAGQPSALPGYGRAVPLPQAAASGGRQNWAFRTTTKSLGLRAPGGAPGVYPVGVEVLNSAQQVVGGMTTFLTFAPKTANYKKVAVGWVWPLIDRQHRANDRTFLDDQLRKDVAAGGRLNGLVSAAATTDTPITWGIDPALLDDVRQMSEHDYAVKAPGAKPGGDKRKSAEAAAWLSTLKQATKGDPYFTVPYADPDVLALVRHKMTRDVQIGYDPRNTGLVSRELGRPADAHIAWPALGLAGPDTLDLLAKLALKQGGSFLMSSQHFQPPPTGGPSNAVTTIPTSTQGTKKALLYDDKLNEIVSSPSRSSYSALLTEQRFLAETAMIAGETPNVQRAVIVAPDRNWNPAPGLARNLLYLSGHSPWLSPTALGKFETAQPQTRTFNGVGQKYERYELGLPYLSQVRNIARRAASFQAVLVPPVTISYERALLRAESTSWRSHGERAKRARDELSDELAREMDKVRIVTTKNRRANMAGSSGRLPVTVENKLRGQRVKVRLSATSANSAKLRLGRLGPDEEIIELRPGEVVQRWIPAQAAGNGNFPVHLQLEIPESNGRRFGKGVDITVRTTGYGRLALLITSGGLAVLFVGVGVRAIRARRRRKSEAAGVGSTGMGPATPGGPGSGFPGPDFPGPAGPAGPMGPADPSGPGPSGSGPGPAGPSGPSGPSQPSNPSGPAAASGPRAEPWPGPLPGISDPAFPESAGRTGHAHGPSSGLPGDAAPGSGPSATPAPNGTEPGLDASAGPGASAESWTSSWSEPAEPAPGTPRTGSAPRTPGSGPARRAPAGPAGSSDPRATTPEPIEAGSGREPAELDTSFNTGAWWTSDTTGSSGAGASPEPGLPGTDGWPSAEPGPPGASSWPSSEPSAPWAEGWPSSEPRPSGADGRPSSESKLSGTEAWTSSEPGPSRTDGWTRPEPGLPGPTGPGTADPGPAIDEFPRTPEPGPPPSGGRPTGKHRGEDRD
ncbi:DUF6049 family protein [Actinomadura terrae]|uniref:DUF6049 family protein n=1 Tax=Actinomadura terrae TaxID=604353 RepID=UPI001FA6E542|nr:DUF6049 family protein [Actinomadura terrae]